MTLGVVAPSGAGRDRATVDRGAAALERLGFKVAFGRHVDKARVALDADAQRLCIVEPGVR